MGIITSYKCDCCGAETMDKQTVHEVQVLVQKSAPRVSFSDRYLHCKHQKIVCHSCAVRLHLTYAKSTEEAPPEPPSFEELLRQLIREEMQEE